MVSLCFVVGKIARRVSFVHYPDPEELKSQKPENTKLLNIKNGGTTTYTGSQSRLSTPARSSMRNTASTHSSRHNNTSSKIGDSSIKKRRHVGGESSGSKDRSTVDSGRGRSAHTSGSLMQSQ